MKHSAARIVREYLILQGVFADPESSSGVVWPLYFNYSPDREGVPDAIGTMYDTAGLKDGRISSGKNILHYGVQLRVRAQTPDDGWEKADAAAKVLEAVAGTVLSVAGRVYSLKNVSQASPVLYIGIEGGTERLSVFTVNFLCTIADASETQGPLQGGNAQLERIITKTASYAVQPVDSGAVFATTGALAEVDFHLPPWSLGLSFTFYNDVAQNLKVIADTGDRIRLGGNLSSLGGSLETLNRGSSAKVMALSTGEWAVEDATGNWSVV